MPPGLNFRYLAGFHIKKYASSVCLKDLNGSGELSGRGPFRPGTAEVVREEDRFHYWEKNVGKSTKLDLFLNESDIITFWNGNLGNAPVAQLDRARDSQCSGAGRTGHSRPRETQRGPPTSLIRLEDYFLLFGLKDTSFSISPGP